MPKSLYIGTIEKQQEDVVLHIEDARGPALRLDVDSLGPFGDPDLDAFDGQHVVVYGEKGAGRSSDRLLVDRLSNISLLPEVIEICIRVKPDFTEAAAKEDFSPASGLESIKKLTNARDSVLISSFRDNSAPDILYAEAPSYTQADEMIVELKKCNAVADAYYTLPGVRLSARG